MGVALVLVATWNGEYILVRPGPSCGGSIAKAGRVARIGARRPIHIVHAIYLGPCYGVSHGDTQRGWGITIVHHGNGMVGGKCQETEGKCG